MLDRSVTLQIRLPIAAECRLIHNGKLIKTWKDNEFCTYITSEPAFIELKPILNTSVKVGDGFLAIQFISKNQRTINHDQK